MAMRARPSSGHPRPRRGPPSAACGAPAIRSRAAEADRRSRGRVYRERRPIAPIDRVHAESRTAYSEAMALSTVIAGCDLSVPSDNALERAIAIAELHRAKIVLVHAQASEPPVVEVDNAMVEQLGELSAAVRAEEAVRLGNKLAEIQGLGLRASVISRIGAPDEVLAGAAHDEAADLVVVGTHGHTGVSRFLLGSVASATVRRAPCDVLVVRGAPVRAPFTKPLVASDFSPAATTALGRAANAVPAGTPIDVVHAWQLPAGSW